MHIQIQNYVLAHNQSSNKTSPQNQSLTTVTGKAQTIAINKTSIPDEQICVTVNQTTKPVQSQGQLKPLKNQASQQQVPRISGINNKTMVQATGLPLLQ